MEAETLSIRTIPERVYRDPDPTGQATLTFWAWVPRVAADVTLRQASIWLKAGRKAPVELRVLEAAELAAIHHPPPELLGIDAAAWLRHQLRVPIGVRVSRIEYELAVAVDGVDRRLEVEIEVADYDQKTTLLFPLRGKFAIVFGHASEGDHLERSQAFAYDIAPLGPRYELLARGDGSANADFAGWGREVRAPAPGVVVRAQAEVPDNPAPGQLADLDSRPEGVWALLGNGMVIDHGQSEFSLLGHLQRGSLTVRQGNRVVAGQTVGRVGNSGHSTGPHLHYHLMDGPDIFRSNGLPSSFAGTETPIPRRGAMEEAE